MKMKEQNGKEKSITLFKSELLIYWFGAIRIDGKEESRGRFINRHSNARKFSMRPVHPTSTIEKQWNAVHPWLTVHSHAQIVCRLTICGPLATFSCPSMGQSEQQLTPCRPLGYLFIYPAIHSLAHCVLTLCCLDSLLHCALVLSVCVFQKQQSVETRRHPNANQWNTENR